MEKIDTETKRLSTIIDQHLLSAYPDSFSLVRSFYNYCDAISITDQQAEEELSRIEADISGGVDKESVLQRLAQEHWYVGCLMDVLVKKKIAEFNEAIGSTIDELYYAIFDVLYHNADKSNVKNFAYKRIFEHLLNEIDNADGLVPEELRGLCFTVLKADHMEPSSLAMSTDGRYLRATDHNKVDVVWNTESGNITTCLVSEKPQGIEWIPAEKDSGLWGLYEKETYSVATQNYYATVKNVCTLDDVYESRVITLSKRPDLALYVYQKAFKNSQNNVQELIALRDAKYIGDINGFPKDNFKQLVAKRINQLMLESATK
jgi:hypothetical protein